MKYCIISLILLMSISGVYCKTWTNWIIIPTDESMSYERKWDKLFYFTAKRYEVNLYSKENGYINTGWVVIDDNKDVKLIGLFCENKENLEIKFIVREHTREGYKYESDKTEIETIKMDLMGLLSR